MKKTKLFLQILFPKILIRREFEMLDQPKAYYYTATMQSKILQFYPILMNITNMLYCKASFRGPTNFRQILHKKNGTTSNHSILKKIILPAAILDTR